MHISRAVQFHVNIVANRRQLQAIRSRNAAPGLAFLLSLLIILALKLQDNWYFIFVLIGLLVSFIMVFFPFYTNALVHVTDKGILLKKGPAIIKSMKWGDIQHITFKDRGAITDYGNYIEVFVQLDQEEVKFGIYRYLFKSKRKITREFIRAIFQMPDAKDKLPGELVERYSHFINSQGL